MYFCKDAIGIRASFLKNFNRKVLKITKKKKKHKEDF